MTAPTRRNDPCPCGSGQRYKDCHGKLAAEPADSIDAMLQLALASHQRGAIDEAARGYEAVLARSPGNAVATHYLGMVAWQRGDARLAEERMREALRADASVPDFHNNLGLLLRDAGRPEEAIACFRRALEVDPSWVEASSNLGLALESAGRWQEARSAYGSALERAPAFAAAHQNLARVLLTLGEHGAGWQHYRWRLVAQGLVSTAPDAAASPLPASLAGRGVVLVAEQGIGDVLFFLRYAPLLVARGATLAFAGDARLHSMLERTGLFAAGLFAASAAPAGMQPVFVGDLPWLLGNPVPAPLSLTAKTELRPGFSETLLRPGFSVVTWRAGVATPGGPARTQLKEIAPEALGGTLRGRKTRWVSIQRQPRDGERERLEQALGAPVEDASAINDDLEAMLSLLHAADDYVGVSNANTHLRAGLGKQCTVLVPFPPEWRWGTTGSSPWFPHAKVVRQSASGEWDLAALAT